MRGFSNAVQQLLGYMSHFVNIYTKGQFFFLDNPATTKRKLPIAQQVSSYILTHYVDIIKHGTIYRSIIMGSYVKLWEMLDVGSCSNNSRVYNGSCYFIESLSGES